jgi:hypothetical protein
MKKEVKELIASQKLTDEDIYTALKAYKKAESPAADEELNGVESQSTTKVDDKKEFYTMAEMESLIAQKVAAAVSPSKKEDPLATPNFENKTIPPLYKVLKMK